MHRICATSGLITGGIQKMSSLKTENNLANMRKIILTVLSVCSVTGGVFCKHAHNALNRQLPKLCSFTSCTPTGWTKTSDLRAEWCTLSKNSKNLIRVCVWSIAEYYGWASVYDTLAVVNVNKRSAFVFRVYLTESWSCLSDGFRRLLSLCVNTLRSSRAAVGTFADYSLRCVVHNSYISETISSALLTSSFSGIFLRLSNREITIRSSSSSDAISALIDFKISAWSRMFYSGF